MTCPGVGPALVVTVQTREPPWFSGPTKKVTVQPLTSNPQLSFTCAARICLLIWMLVTPRWVEVCKNFAFPWASPCYG